MTHIRIPAPRTGSVLGGADCRLSRSGIRGQDAVRPAVPGIATFLSIGVLATVFFASCSSVLPSVFDVEAKRYVADHAVSFSLDGADDAETFEMLRSVYGHRTDNTKVVFVGERHAATVNFQVLELFFDYFRADFGVTTYLSEKGVASGYLVDRYLHTGDQRILDAVMSMISTSSAYSLEQSESFRSLRRTWLSSGGSFRYIGVDVEHAVSAPVAAVSLIADEKAGDPPAPVAAICDLGDDYWGSEFPAWGHPDVPTIRARVAELHEVLQPGHAEAERVRDYLGVDYEITLLMMESAVAAYEFYELYETEGYSAADTLRESSILELFETHHAMHAKPEEAVYFGQWGSFHVHRRPVHGENTVASMLDRPGGLFAGKVLSTSIFYDRCSYHDARAGRRRRIDDDAGAYLGRIVGTAPAVIPLDLASSPFARELFLVGGAEPGTVTTDYIQVAVLVAGSEAVTPYR